MSELWLEAHAANDASRDDMWDWLEAKHYELAHTTHRMLQALDGYWEHCEGLSYAKARTVRSTSTAEDWWHRYEKYRARVQAIIKELP